jgi:Uncharacterized protein conserved in bacteria
LIHWLKIGSRIFLSTLVGVIVASLIIEDEPWLKTRIEQAIIEQMNSAYDCKITAHVERLRLIGGEVTFSDMHADACSEKPEEQWSWHAKRVVVGWSWMRLLISRVIDLDIALDSAVITTQSDGKKLAVMPHLASLMAQVDSVMPVVIRTFEIRNGVANIIAPTLQSDISVGFIVDLYVHNSQTRLVIALDSGVLTVKKRTMLQKIAGTVSAVIAYDGSLQDAHADIVFDALQLPQGKQRCTLVGLFSPQENKLDLYNDDRSLSGTVSLQEELTAHAHIPFSYVVHILGSEAVDVSGDCFVEASGKLADLEHTFKGELKLTDARYEKTLLPEIQLATTGMAHFSQGTLDINLPHKFSTHNLRGQGSWRWDAATENYVIDIKNTFPIMLPAAWEIEPCALVLHAQFDNEYHCKASYQSIFTHQKRHERKQVKGTIVADREYIQIVGGSESDLTYEFDVALTAPWHIRTVAVRADDMELVALTGAADGAFSGTVAYPTLRAIMQMVAPGVEQEFSGEGVFALNGVINNGQVRAKIELEHGMIRLPYTYNLLQTFTAGFSIDSVARKFTATDIHFGLHKGDVKISRLTLMLDDAYTISFLHAPVLLHDCFLSWKKDLFALLSGALMVRYDPIKGAAITGQLIFDRSHMRGNVLAPSVKDDIFGMTVKPLMWYQNNSAVALAVAVKTRAPLQVKTSFLEATVRSNVVVRGTLAQPELFGDLELLNGQLIFPYQPLYIVRGKIFFLANQLDDPGIELVARGVIKKYSLEMSVTGTVGSPTIRFESSPSLTEEQIIGLLLGGSEDGSLSLALPTMVKTNIEHLLFGPAEESSAMQQSLKKLFKPLRNVKIVPSFSDQSGRGGLRGTLAIEVNDRLRGKIQQNFSLSEDILLEVEYSLSDDTLIRGMLDERGDLGAEIETRWKF